MSENIAILLDLDNIKPDLHELEKICEQFGIIVERRAFSNTPTILTAYGSKLRDFGYRFELSPGISIVPQEVDNLICRTSEDLINNSSLHIDVIAVVSNDNDYANLFQDLASRGVKTLAIGNNQLGNKLREKATYFRLLTNVLRPTYLGIDLGTTNTVIAIAKQKLTQNQPWTANAINVPVKNEQQALENTLLIPSSVRFSQSGNVEIGKHVRNQSHNFEAQTILAWKHDIGTLKDGKPFEYELSFSNKKPEEAAAEVLKFCRQKLLDKQIDVGGVVITHPASYEPDAIEATREAANLAGWEKQNIVLLPEPKAALYDFLYRLSNGDIFTSLDTSNSLNILVYDLGGGTLDTSLHNVKWDTDQSRFIIDDISIGSRTRVGGDQVDERIVDYLFSNYSRIKNRLSVEEQKKLRQELKIYAEKFKKLWGAEYLNSQEGEEFKLAFQYSALDSTFPIYYSFSHKQMQEALRDLLCPDIKPELINTLDPRTAFNQSPFIDRYNTFIVPVLDVLLKAKLRLGTIPKIDAILLNGGMTYFPLIQERLASLLPGILTLSEGDPDLAVARGAALYACGALKPTEGINPTNIWLEVTNSYTEESHLELLVAQGQKYPYQTTLNGFKLPAIDQGLIGFNAWVGMGSRPNQNTTLQLTRCVQAQEILSANIQSGDYLNLEVEYTFDERLLLTLVDRDRPEVRFRLEVSSKQSQPQNITTPLSPNVVARDLIPKIPRSRIGNIVDGDLQINFADWVRVALNLSQSRQNSRFQQEKRQLEYQTCQAANRLSIARNLLSWLESSEYINSDLQRTRREIAAKALFTIMQTLPSDPTNHSDKVVEQKYHNWILQEFQSGLFRFQSNYELYSAIALTPGKMLWLDFGELLYREFNNYSNRPASSVLLNSFGICAEASRPNIIRLQSIIQTNNHLALRLKAFWALARLISIGQPLEWQATFDDVERVAYFVLDQLMYRVREPQVATEALACLIQCIAWHITGHPLNEGILRDILSLGKIDLPCQRNMRNFPAISVQFNRRLELVERAFDLSKASAEDIQEIKLLLKAVE